MEPEDVAPASKMIYLSSIKKRGWTDAVVKALLPQPDKIVQNPHYRSAAKAKLWFLDRVIAIENSDAYAEWLTKNAARRDAAKCVSAQKRQAKIDAEEAAWKEVQPKIEGLSVVLSAIEKEQLIGKATDHYNNSERNYISGAPLASRESDPLFLERISVNYVRHIRTNYDKWLDEYGSGLAANRCRDAIRSKVYDAITAAHPWLAEECKRQIERRRLMEEEV